MCTTVLATKHSVVGAFVVTTAMVTTEPGHAGTITAIISLRSTALTSGLIIMTTQSITETTVAGDLSLIQVQWMFSVCVSACLLLLITLRFIYTTWHGGTTGKSSE